jgi:PAS domain S-box-containing protein
MNRFVRQFRSFTQSLGLVEQAQMVASTAVLVIMVTIISANIILNKLITWFDFISIVTVGIIGFVSVYFSLKYGRQLDEQKRELEALNTVAEAVIRTIDLNFLLNNVLQIVVQLSKTQFGWIYIFEGKHLLLEHSVGTKVPFLTDDALNNIDNYPKLFETQTTKSLSLPATPFINPEIMRSGISTYVYLPLRAADQFAGALILASTVDNFFSEKKVDLISAFGNHISFALNNARLFERLQKSEQQYADLFEHSPDMYHLVNKDGTIISCNQTEVQTLGYEKSDIIGNHLQELYPPAYRDHVKNILYQAFSLNKEIRGSEEQMLKKDGSLIDVSVNTSLVMDNGIPILLRCVVRDITEKKILEQKIMQAQKIDSIGNLAGGIAHDFNNILASILGSASIMRRRMKPKDKWYQFVDVIEIAAKRGASLTRQLLTFARRNNVEVHPIDIHSIIEETLNLFVRSINPYISITKEFTTDIVVINGDEGQVQQALLNIMLNARDAMPNGGTLTIETRCADITDVDGITYTGESRSGDHVAVTIADTGIGMTKEIQQRIFEPFFSTKEHGKGTGLGLSVVYGVVKSHGGHIAVQSNPEKGTRFTIFLPLLQGKFAHVGKKSSEKIVGGNESILIVDDEEIVSTTISAMLIDLGYCITTASGGKEALAILKRQPSFDLILLDMTMPEMGGEQVYKKIRRMKISAKVIISSGYSDSILSEKSFLTKIDGFLQKPYVIEELAMKVRAVLDTVK